jgi:hypothetical protein
MGHLLVQTKFESFIKPALLRSETSIDRSINKNMYVVISQFLNKASHLYFVMYFYQHCWIRRADHATLPLSSKVLINFADGWRSLGRYSSLPD